MLINVLFSMWNEVRHLLINEKKASIKWKQKATYVPVYAAGTMKKI